MLALMARPLELADLSPGNASRALRHYRQDRAGRHGHRFQGAGAGAGALRRHQGPAARVRQPIPITSSISRRKPARSRRCVTRTSSRFSSSARKATSFSSACPTSRARPSRTGSRRKRWFNEEHAKWFLSHAIAALHSAHKANIVHLDIKPANFLVDRANNIMLTDFGLAQKIVKDAGEDARARGVRHAGLRLAGANFTRSPTDQRTDIYSLGATLFHLMTGQPPFNGADGGGHRLGPSGKAVPARGRPARPTCPPAGFICSEK